LTRREVEVQAPRDESESTERGEKGREERREVIRPFSHLWRILGIPQVVSLSICLVYRNLWEGTDLGKKSALFGFSKSSPI
jgi:hypothetical protein